MVTGRELRQARQAAEQACRALRALEHRAAAERQTQERRAAVELAAAPYLEGIAGHLEESGARVREALDEVMRAAVEVLDAAAGHTGRVREWSAALADVGLVMGDGREHETGAAGDGLRVAGAWHLPVDGASVLAGAVYLAARAHLGEGHALCRALAGPAGVEWFERRLDGLWRGVEPPAASTADGA